MVPPRPSPSLASAKVSGRGARKLEKNISDDFLSFLWKKNEKHPLPRGFKRCSQLKSTKTTAVVFPRGSKKKKSNNDDKHGHGQEKRRPSTLCLGKKCWIFVRALQTNIYLCGARRCNRSESDWHRITSGANQLGPTERGPGSIFDPIWKKNG